MTRYCIERPSRIVNTSMSPLAHCVARFCDLLVRTPDAHSVPPGKRRAKINSQQSRAHNVRDHLLEATIAISDARDRPATDIHAWLHFVQLSYRSFQGLLAGVPDRLLDNDAASELTVRHVLMGSLDFYERHAPVSDVLDAAPLQDGLQTIASPALAVQESSPASADRLSTLFERSERLHNSLVRGLGNVPDAPAYVLRLAGIEPALSRVADHLRAQRAVLRHLLESIGHHRTEPMLLAHEVFVSLGYMESALTGTEARFDRTCRSVIDLIEARTTELNHYY